MKRNILLILTIYFLGFESIAQINLVAKQYDFMTGSSYIVKWQALDSSSQTAYPLELTSVYFSSSVFDANNSNYYLTGNTSTSSGLLEFNTMTNTSVLKSFTSFSNITEIDMSTGKIYNLKANEEGQIFVNQYDIETGADSVIGVINEPGIPGLIVGTTCFDSNHGILYYIGTDQTSTLVLFGIHVRDEEFSFTKIPLVTYAPGNNFGDVNFDNVKNTIFARVSLFNGSGQYIGCDVVEVNVNNGNVTLLGNLNEFPYFLAGCSAYDQVTGSQIMVGSKPGFIDQMIIFNTNTNTYETGYLPDGVSEICCDNHDFAVNQYLTSVRGDFNRTDIAISPNPADTWISVTGIENLQQPVSIRILNSVGQIVSSHDNVSINTARIDVSSLYAGFYFVQIHFKNGFEIRKINVL